MRPVAIALGSLLLVPLLVLGTLGGGAAGQVVLEDGELTQQVLSHPNIRLRPAAVEDVTAGVVDPRILRLLLILAQEHHLGAVGPFRAGHSYFVRGTNRVSNHVFGRAVDISVIDGAPVSLSNLGTLQAVETVLALPAGIRPDEVGSPWMILTPGVSVFNRFHDDHLHLGTRS